MSTLRVHTTQNVTLEYEIASLGDRIVAALIDHLLYLAWAVGIVLASNYLHLTWLLPYVILLPIVFYNLVCEVFFNGQSLGKHVRKIRVMRLDGTAPHLGDYCLRWLLRLVDTGFGGGIIAIITIAINGKGQRLGDLLAGTTVLSIQPRATALLATELVTPAGYQPVFAQASQLSDHDAALLRQLLSRGIQQHNYVLLNETASKIKYLLHLESDLPDEAFLRTVLRDHAHLIAAE